MHFDAHVRAEERNKRTLQYTLGNFHSPRAYISNVQLLFRCGQLRLLPKDTVGGGIGDMQEFYCILLRTSRVHLEATQSLTGCLVGARAILLKNSKGVH